MKKGILLMILDSVLKSIGLVRKRWYDEQHRTIYLYYERERELQAQKRIIEQDCILIVRHFGRFLKDMGYASGTDLYKWFYV